MPTDTQYGLVAVASNTVAVERLYGLKNRIQKLGTIIAADIEQLEKLGIKHRYLKAVEGYWPGPISVVVPAIELGYLHLGKNTLAVRIPGNVEVVKLLQRTGALLTTSANAPDQPPANTIQEAQDYFGDTVDFYVDGGDLTDRKPSTIIRIVDDAVEVLREGAVKIDEETGGIIK